MLGLLLFFYYFFKENLCENPNKYFEISKGIFLFLSKNSPQQLLLSHGLTYFTLLTLLTLFTKFSKYSKVSKYKPNENELGVVFG